MQTIHFNKFVAYDDKGEYFDNQPIPNEFYEKDYLRLNPELDTADTPEKMNIARKAINFLVENSLATPIKIIDVGSGSMLVLRGVLDYIQQLTKKDPVGLAVDLSGSILQNTDSYDDICKLRAEASDLPVGDNSFDLLIMFDLIEHTIEPHKVIREALRVSNHVLIKTPLEQSLYSLFRGGAKRFKKLEMKYGHIQHFKRADVLSALGDQTKVLTEFYEIIPNRSFVIDKLQKILLMLGFYAIFRYLFGGFIVLLIKR